jgi:hypothetical protein
LTPIPLAVFLLSIGSAALLVSRRRTAARHD